MTTNEHPGPPRDARRRRDEGYLAWMTAWKATSLAAHEIEAVMRRTADLSLTWGEVLARLDEAPEGRLAMNELARQIFVSRSGVSQVVTAMGKHGLVERQSDPANLRTTYAVITARGRAVLRDSATAFLSAIHEHFGRHLAPGEAQQITDALTRVITALSGATAPPPTLAADAPLDPAS